MCVITAYYMCVNKFEFTNRNIWFYEYVSMLYLFCEYILHVRLY